MAYLTIARICGDPDHLLDGYRRASAVMDQVGRDHGLILHAGARTGDGLLVVNLWPSRDGFEAAAGRPSPAGRPESRAPWGPERFHREHHEVERYLVMAGERCSG